MPSLEQGMPERLPASRLRRLPTSTVRGREVLLASTFRARLLGLAHLGLEEAGPGLLIPRCSSVHTFGMRFSIDLHFLDRSGRRLELRRAVPPRRLASCRGASAVLEIPVGKGGEFSPPRP